MDEMLVNVSYQLVVILFCLSLFGFVVFNMLQSMNKRSNEEIIKTKTFVDMERRISELLQSSRRSLELEENKREVLKKKQSTLSKTKYQIISILMNNRSGIPLYQYLLTALLISTIFGIVGFVGQGIIGAMIMVIGVLITTVLTINVLSLRRKTLEESNVLQFMILNQANFFSSNSINEAFERTRESLPRDTMAYNALTNYIHKVFHLSKMEADALEEMKQDFGNIDKVNRLIDTFIKSEAISQEYKYSSMAIHENYEIEVSTKRAYVQSLMIGLLGYAGVGVVVLITSIVNSMNPIVTYGLSKFMAAYAITLFGYICYLVAGIVLFVSSKERTNRIWD